MNKELNINFLQNSLFSLTYSREFSVGYSTSETSLLIYEDTLPISFNI